MGLSEATSLGKRLASEIDALTSSGSPKQLSLVLETLEQLNSESSDDLDDTPGALALDEFLAFRFPPRLWLVKNLIQEKDAAMIYAPRGTGKTFVGISLAIAGVTGEPLFSGERFPVDRPFGVLYLDGEMPARDLQERFNSLLPQGRKMEAPLRVLAADQSEDGMPSLASKRGQMLVERELDAHPELKLVIVDSISTLCATESAENDAASWDDIQRWVLALRRRGVAILFFHHTNKTGDQRGTSKREDVLAQVLELSRPKGYKPSEGARFVVTFKKARGVRGPAARAFEAQPQEDKKGNLSWNTGAVGTHGKVLELAGQGLSDSEIADRLKVDRSTVNRHRNKAKESGDL